MGHASLMAMAAFKRWTGVTPDDGARHEASLERWEAFEARRERHIGRIEASIEALAIARLATARLSCVRQPGEDGSPEAWRRFGQTASAALEDLSARMVQLAAQMSEETALLDQEMRCAHRGERDTR